MWLDTDNNNDLEIIAKPLEKEVIMYSVFKHFAL